MASQSWRKHNLLQLFSKHSSLLLLRLLLPTFSWLSTYFWIHIWRELSTLEPLYATSFGSWLLNTSTPRFMNKPKYPSGWLSNSYVPEGSSASDESIMFQLTTLHVRWQWIKLIKLIAGDPVAPASFYNDLQLVVKLTSMLISEGA